MRRPLGWALVLVLSTIACDEADPDGTDGNLDDVPCTSLFGSPTENTGLTHDYPQETR